MGWPPSRGSTSRRPTRFTLRLNTLACTGSASIAATGRSRATSKKAAPSRPRASSPTAASSSRRDLAWSFWTSSAPAGSVPGTPFLFVDGRPPLLAAPYRLTLRPACSRLSLSQNALDISHLRSPTFFQPHPGDINALKSYAETHSRTNELVEIGGVVGREWSKHQMKRCASSRSTVVARWGAASD
jgi:hypothetical protein